MDGFITSVVWMTTCPSAVVTRRETCDSGTRWATSVSISIANGRVMSIADVSCPAGWQMRTPRTLPAQPQDRADVVADEQHGAAFTRDLAHFAEALLLERDIADGQDLVYQQD